MERIDGKPTKLQNYLQNLLSAAMTLEFGMSEGKSGMVPVNVRYNGKSPGRETLPRQMRQYSLC